MTDTREPMPLHRAQAILRGNAGVTTPEDRRTAALVVLRAMEQLQLVEVLARRFVDATDGDTRDRALRRLRETFERR
ncbi:hypothetical protein [Pseudonocardia sp. ICBG1034]|uniref:hypothetical protein n=1 Tax=Pseudonocardia sp. ICBG1034 TaxID=2844381 RepID=UPI001CCBA95D|nr:hypothetical protein [Pseudonocardia sp. ICBG1034]